MTSHTFQLACSFCAGGKGTLAGEAAGNAILFLLIVLVFVLGFFACIIWKFSKLAKQNSQANHPVNDLKTYVNSPEQTLNKTHLQ